MFDRASKKLALDQVILEGDADDDSGYSPIPSTKSSSNPLKRSKREIEELLRKGIYGCILEDDENDEAIEKFLNTDIDTIMKENTRNINLMGGHTHNEGGSMFSKTVFNPEKNNDMVQLDDPQFWEKVLDKPTAGMLLERLEDSSYMESEENRHQFVRDVELLVEEIREAKRDHSEELNTHEYDTTCSILVFLSCSSRFVGPS